MVNEINNQKGFLTMTVAISRDSSTEMNLFPIHSLGALCIWLILNSFFGKKRPTQDQLNFHLKRFQSFYITINALSLIVINPKNISFMFITIILILMIIVNFIIKKRSIRLVFALQGFLILQTCLILSLLFITVENMHLGQKILEIFIYCLYLATILTALNKAKKHLIQEKKTESLTP